MCLVAQRWSRHGRGQVLTGIGAIGYCQRFDATIAQSVRAIDERFKDSDGDESVGLRLSS